VLSSNTSKLIITVKKYPFKLVDSCITDKIYSLPMVKCYITDNIYTISLADSYSIQQLNDSILLTESQQIVWHTTFNWQSRPSTTGWYKKAGSPRVNSHSFESRVESLAPWDLSLVMSHKVRVSSQVSSEGGWVLSHPELCHNYVTTHESLESWCVKQLETPTACLLWLTSHLTSGVS